MLLRNELGRHSVCLKPIYDAYASSCSSLVTYARQMYMHARVSVAHRRKAAAGQSKQSQDKAIAQPAKPSASSSNDPNSFHHASHQVPPTRAKTLRPVNPKSSKPWLRASKIRAPDRVPRLGGEGGERATTGCFRSLTIVDAIGHPPPVGSIHASRSAMAWGFSNVLFSCF
ncbi:hypothetical protein HDV57DRAFT_504585 [Trichoderma longibrachiatum]